ncbi:MAG: hypothetical protein IKZ43_04670 [Acidaminococcaceae bacterium]|nr:hypothetical protein [Acidaminococcaceae bacterium]
MSPSVAEAADPVIVTGYTNSGGFTPSGSMRRNSVGSGGYYNAYPADESVTVLNIAPGVEDAWEDGASKVSVWGHSGTEASGYTVTMTGEKAQLYKLYGGIYKAEGYGSYLGTANENTVSVSDKAAVGTSVYGGHINARSNSGSVSNAQGTADKNTVTVSGDATVGENVYGGDAYTYIYAYAASGTTAAEGKGTADANDNTVTISGSATVGNDVYGGSAYNDAYTYVYSYDYTATGVSTSNADNNTVTISNNASAGNDVYGGYAFARNYASYVGVETNTVSGSANNNTVTISDNALVGDDVYGGYAYAYAYYGVATADATANENSVTISGVTVKGDIIGGLASASAYTYVYDGTSAAMPAKGTASANENTVTINGAAVSGTVTGGYAYAYAYAYYGGEITVEGTADNNTVIISGDTTVGNNIIGGNSTGSADNNTVTISGDTVVNAILDQYGYYTTANIIGGNSTGEGDNNSGSADNNTVTISGDTVVGESSSAYASVYIYGGHSKNGSRSVSGNTVTISENVVVGRSSSSSEDAYVSAYIYGGYGESSSGNADNNTVAISDNVVVADGSYSNAYIYGGRTSSGSANENKVTISDNAVVSRGYASITGGYGRIADENTVTISGKASVGSGKSAYVTGGNSTAYDADELSANNNTVTITDDAVVGYGYVYGGYAYYGTVSNNTVTISGNAVVGGKEEERIYGGVSGYGIAESNTVTISDNAAVGSESDVYIYGGLTYYAESADNNTVTISDNAAVDSKANMQIYGGLSYDNGGSADNNKITVSDNAAVTISKNDTGSSSVVTTKLSVFGGYSGSGSADKNEITFSGDKVTVDSDGGRLYIYGGYSKNENATTNDNKVTISGKAAVGANASYVSVYGGGGKIETIYYYSISYDYSTAAADNNTVTISENAAIGANASYVSVYGGLNYSGSTGNQTSSANKNTVTISDNAVVGVQSYVSVYGGYATFTANENTVTISDNAVVGGEYAYIYGGESNNNSADNNAVTISNDAVVGGEYAYIYGGAGQTTANENTVTISNDAVVGGAYAYIIGGYGKISASENTITISDNAAVAATGSNGYVSITGGDSNAYGLDGGGSNKNTVTISGDAVVGPKAYSMDITGGRSYYGLVSDNTVTISDNVVVASGSNENPSYYYMRITGGETFYNGISKDNTVTISGGTVGNADNYKDNMIFGGASTAEATGNKVVIEGDAKVYAGAVVGGNSDYAYGSAANVTDNTVTITAKGAEVGLVYGGRTYKGDASNNTVALSAGSVTGNVASSGYYGIVYVAAVAGGYSLQEGDATSNTVELSGVTVNIPEEDSSAASSSMSSSSAGSSSKITMGVVGGFAGTGDATGNTVKLQDVTITGGVYGGADNTTAGITGSGESTGSSGDVVTGNTLIISGSNTVNGEVTNFETIKLADTLAWSDGATILQAAQFTDNADGTRASLDITDAEANLAAATSGQMTLLASDTADDFKTLSLKYSGGTEALSETNLSKILKTGEGTPESTPTNGVTLTSASTQVVSLDADNSFKNVLYKVESITSKISLGAMTWGTARDLSDYTISASATIDASGLSFTGTENTPLKANDSMKLVSGASGISAIPAGNITQPGEGKGTVAVEYTDSNNIKFNATASGSVGVDGSDVKYTVNSVATDKVTLGSLAWGTTAEMPDSSWTASGATQIDDTAFAYTGTASTALKINDTATILNAPGLTTASPVTDGTAEGKTVSVEYANDAGVTFAGTAKGHVASATDAVQYVVDNIVLTDVNLSGWTNTETAVPDTWTGDDGSVKVNAGSFAALEVAEGNPLTILTAGSPMFADGNITGANKYDETKPSAFTDVKDGVTVAGLQAKGVQASADGKSLVYAGGTKNADSVDINTVAWQKDATVFDGSAGYDFTNVGAIGTDHFAMTYNNPEDVAVNDSMILLQANATLQEMAEESKKSSFSFNPVSGVRIDGDITGTLSASGNKVTFTTTANQATQLTFTNVEWKDTLMTRPANIVFDGAKVVTTDIKFTNIDSQVADQTMTLVKNFDGTPSAIEGDHYMVGSGRTGEGAAEMSGTDLIFRTKTGTVPTEATHETVMAMEAGTAVIAAGREFVDSAVEGLGMVSNIAPDGTSTFASMGGGTGRYKTGSHIDTNTWNAVVAVGSKKELKKGNLEWGVFAEYGRGNYTLFDDNGGRGDGDTHYAGGGLLAKWTNKHNVYTEASIRMGRMSDTASHMLTDRLGNSYGYDIDANYVGAHVGLGKIIKVKDDRDLDVYGKFFYLRRNGVNFDAGGNHYNLDSVASKLLRIGARYGSNDKKWNWYGGLAYEYEFGGQSSGTVDGLPIRSASIKGSSVRGELGMRMEATKTNPWKADIGIYGYGGQHRGFGGTVSVAYMF